jgi:hypothetical protein
MRCSSQQQYGSLDQQVYKSVFKNDKEGRKAVIHQRWSGSSGQRIADIPSKGDLILAIWAVALSASSLQNKTFTKLE